jgi:hypothetical protein
LSSDEEEEEEEEQIVESNAASRMKTAKKVVCNCLLVPTCLKL